MNYKLRHVTTYRYSKTVTFARCALRLTPQQGLDQTVLHSHIAITPTPSRLEERIGQFGEPVVTAIIDTPHQELKIGGSLRGRRPPRVAPARLHRRRVGRGAVRGGFGVRITRRDIPGQLHLSHDHDQAEPGDNRLCRRMLPGRPLGGGGGARP